jgi:hypothetical protein
MSRLRGWRVAAIIVVAAGSLLATSAGAWRLNGSSSTAAYVQEVAKAGSEDTFENRTRLYERLRIDVMELAHPRLSLHTYGTLSNDVTNESLGDTRTRLYNAYLQYRPASAGTDALRYDIRLGRQWVLSGVGAGTIDGLVVSTDRPGWGGLTLFGGTLGMDTRDQLRFDAPKDSRRFGGDLRILPRVSEGYEPELGVSFAATSRNDVDENQKIGARAALRVRRQLRLWTEVRHDLLLDRTYGTAAGVEFLKPARQMRLWAEFNRRTPAFPATSFFSVWDTKPVSDVRGGVGMGVAGPVRLILDFTRTDFRAQTKYVDVGGAQVSRSKVDRATSYRVVLERNAAQIGVRFSSGFGGDRTGLVASLNQDIGERVNVNLDLGYETYDYGSNAYEDNTATTGILALSYKAARNTRITTQIEAMNNRDLKQDIRLLARVDQRFRLGR